MLDCMCAFALWSGMVRMDTWVARDVWMCAAMRVRARACMHAWHACVLCHLCACARALVYGAHVRGAAPATARDADQAFAVDINVRTTTRTFASSLHWEMHMLAHACACVLFRDDGFAPVTVCDALRSKLSPSWSQ